MDAYDIINMLKQAWMQALPRHSGSGEKYPSVAIMVKTDNGYREVTGCRINKEINAIELLIDED